MLFKKQDRLSRAHYPNEQQGNNSELLVGQHACETCIHFKQQCSSIRQFLVPAEVAHLATCSTDKHEDPSPRTCMPCPSHLYLSI